MLRTLNVDLVVKARIASSHSACELGVMQPLASQFAPNETVVHVRGAEGGAWCPCLAEGGGGDDAAAATLIITPRARRVAQRILGDYRQIRRQVSLRAALRQYAPAEKAAAICVAASSHFSKLLHSSPEGRKLPDAHFRCEMATSCET